MTQNRDRKQAIRARMSATGEPYTVAARAISASDAGGAPPAAQLASELDAVENGRYDDDFVADRHVDLDAGEFGGAMTDADYYDRIAASTEAGRPCPDCGGRGWKRTPDSEDYDCRTCGGEGYVMTAAPNETANLVGQLVSGYRGHVAAEAAAVPGRVRGEDVEDQADALADAAARLAELLAAFGQESRRSLDAIAVFRGLSRCAESMAAAATELRRQEWFDLDDEADAEASAAWTSALEGLRSAAGTFKWVADGWI